MPNLTTTIEDYSPLLVYSGSDWTAGTSENDTSLDQYSQSSYMRTNVDGATVFFVFYGDGVQIYGAMRSTHGFYQMGIDTKLYPPVNGEASPDSFQKLLFATAALQNGAHTVKLTNEGKTFSDLDYITFQSTVGGDYESMIINTFQDSDPSFNYYPSSSWSTSPSNLGMFSGGDGHVSSSAGSYVVYTFQGDAISLYGPVGPNGAPYSVQLDNGNPANYSTNKLTYRPQTMLYHGSNLGAGSHTLKITVEPFNSSYSLNLAIDYAEVFTTASIQRASSTASTSSKLSKGAIAGISVASIFGLLFILVGIVYFIRRRRTSRQAPLIIGHNQEKKEADVIEPFAYNALSVNDAPSPPLSQSHSHSQLGHDTLRTQVSFGSLPGTPPTTGLWPTSAGTAAGAASNTDSSDVNSSRLSGPTQELIVPQLRSKYRPDLAPQLSSPPPARTRREGAPSGGGGLRPSIPELQITEEVDAGPVPAEGVVPTGSAGVVSGSSAPPEYSQDPAIPHAQ